MDPKKSKDEIAAESADDPTDIDVSEAAEQADVSTNDEISMDETPETLDVPEETADALEASETDESLLEDTGQEDGDVLEAEDVLDEASEDARTENELDAEPESSVAEHPIAAPAPTPQQKSSIWPAVFGGVIAAMLGFIAGRGDQLDAFLPASMQRQAADLTPLVNQATELSARVGVLETAAPDQDLVSSIDALQSAVASLGDLSDTVSALSDRVSAIEARPVETVETVIQQPIENTETTEVISENTQDIASLQSAIETLQSRIAEDEARAASEAGRLLAQAALTRVVTAIENGETFAPALSALEEVTPVEVPEALRLAASEAVPKLSGLQESFPEAARASLAAARAEVPETEVVGIGGFLRRQLSVRSVVPREGDDADAVLSRAEAALKTGDLDTTLGQLDALPDVAKTAMQSWLDAANTRQNARRAAQELADSLTVN